MQRLYDGLDFVTPIAKNSTVVDMQEQIWDWSPNTDLGRNSSEQQRNNTDVRNRVQEDKSRAALARKRRGKWLEAKWETLSWWMRAALDRECKRNSSVSIQNEEARETITCEFGWWSNILLCLSDETCIISGNRYRTGSDQYTPATHKTIPRTLTRDVWKPKLRAQRAQRKLHSAKIRATREGIQKSHDSK